MPAPDLSPLDRIAAKILAADSLGTTKILLDLADVKAVLTDFAELKQRRSYEEYVNSKANAESDSA